MCCGRLPTLSTEFGHGLPWPNILKEDGSQTPTGTGICIHMQEPSNDPLLIKVVWAMTPWLPDRYSLMGVHMDTIMRCRDMGLNSKLGEYCGLDPRRYVGGVSGRCRAARFDDWTPATGSYIPWRPEADERARLDEWVYAYVTRSPGKPAVSRGSSETGHVLEAGAAPSRPSSTTFVSSCVRRRPGTETASDDGQRKLDERFSIGSGHEMVLQQRHPYRGLSEPVRERIRP